MTAAHTKRNTSEAVESVEEASEAVHTQIDTQTPTAPLNVYQRMVIAQGVIERTVFEKSQKNGTKPLKNGKDPDDGYNSVPIDAMRSAVRRACIEAGLVHVGFIGLEYKQDVRTSKFGGAVYHYEGTASFRYVNADDPEEYVEFFAAGEANDSGDKSLGKMLTNVLKNHYKQCWDIGEHGKDDVDSYSNEEVEDEADRIAERRARRAEAVKNDPFFGKPAEQPDDEVVRLRKQVGAYSMLGEPYATIIKGHKASKPFPEWDLAMLRSVLAECEAAKEGGQ